MTLAGDPSASPPIWLQWTSSHVPIIFPVGYYATFEPTLVVHDPTGVAVARQDDDANVNPQRWPGPYICVYSNPPIARVYRLADVLPQPPST